MTIDLKALKCAVHEDAAIRRLRRLQPIGGPGDKIFPPTYPPARRGAPPRHVFERRRVDREEVWCVLIDSVQSQANRMEEALLVTAEEAGGDGAIPLPYITVDFRGEGLEPLERITSLDAPHRVYDAILRDSFLEGTPFMQSDEGQRLAAAKPADATALLELSPAALLFGAWHSQGEGGGLGAKFPRALVSEIMGIDTPVEDGPADPRTGEVEARTAGRRTGSRIDPLGILRNVEVFKGASVSDWSTDKSAAGKGARPVRPSEIKPQQHSAERRASRCDLRPRGTSGHDHSGRIEKVAFRRWRTRRHGARVDCGSRPRSIGRTGCTRLRPALSLRSGLRWGRAT